MKTRTLLAFALAAVFCCSCNEPFLDYTEQKGFLSFENFDLNADFEFEVVTKASLKPASGAYRIHVYDSRDELVLDASYSDVKATGYGVELKAGQYRVEAVSGEIPAAAFEAPVYGASAEFSIEAGKTTNLEPMICTLRQVGVTVGYEDKLLDMMTGSGKSTVEISQSGKLDYVLTVEDGKVTYEKRTGYFAVNGGACTMVVTFSGNVKGSNQKMVARQFGEIKAGQIHNVQFVKKITAEGNATVGIVIDGYVDDQALAASVSAPLLPVIGEDPARPKGDGGITLGIHPDCTMFSDLGNIVVPSLSTVMDLRLVASIPGGVKKMSVFIESTNSSFLTAVAAAGGPTLDLVNPSADSEVIFQVVPFPHGSGLLGQTELSFDLSGAQEPILGFEGTHTFMMQITDMNSCRKDIPVVMIVK